jgi:hypothetical protein
MLPLFLILLSVLSFNSFNYYPGQRNGTKLTLADDRVIIQRRRVVLVRSGELAKHFPERKRAVVTYPIISGLSDPMVLRRVRSVLDFKNIFDYSLKEYREDAWLSEFSYVVNYNSNYLLDLTFTQSGMAAYPAEHHKHFLISLKDGHIVKAQDVFESKGLNLLAAMVDRELQREIKRLESEIRGSEEKEAVNGAYDNLKFELKDLDEFSVGPKGITFLYDAGFPHVIKALEPKGHYFYSYSALRPYIIRDGLLGQFVDKRYNGGYERQKNSRPRRQAGP